MSGVRIRCREDSSQRVDHPSQRCLAPHWYFKSKNQKYRTYSTRPSAFFRHMHVLHSTCRCLELLCTCKQSIFFYIWIYLSHLIQQFHVWRHKLFYKRTTQTQDVSKNFRFVSSVTNPCTPLTLVQWCFVIRVQWSQSRLMDNKCDQVSWTRLKCIFNKANAVNNNNDSVIILHDWSLFCFICYNSWTDRFRLNKFGVCMTFVGDLPRQHWAEADRWYPECGTESAWTGACPTHSASALGRLPWSSSSTHWCWHDASASPREAYRTPTQSKDGKRQCRGGWW